MSMNLHCKEVELWQTPTAITYMCYSNEDGGWKGILYRYSEWVKGHLNGVWNNDEEYRDMYNKVVEHINKLKSFNELHFDIY